LAIKPAMTIAALTATAASKRNPANDAPNKMSSRRANRRVDHKSPIEVSRVVQCLQLIPVKTVLPIGGGMQDDARER
jgi:hypothetical protein